MAEAAPSSSSCIVEVYENEKFHRKLGWVSYSECPFSMKIQSQEAENNNKLPNMTPCKSIEEITVPDSEWAWSGNWKIHKMPGATDAEGWEYASRFSRFNDPNRTPKAEATWSSVRRRLWTRIMRRDAISVIQASDVQKVLSKVQTGLASIHAARLKIEEIMKQAPEAAQTEQMKLLVASVHRNIVDIISVLDQTEQQQSKLAKDMPLSSNSSSGKGLGAPLNNVPAILKKLRNEVIREQGAISRAIMAPEANNKAGTAASRSSNIAINNGSFSASSGGSGSFSSGSYGSNPPHSPKLNSNSSLRNREAQAPPSPLLSKGLSRGGSFANGNSKSDSSQSSTMMASSYGSKAGISMPISSDLKGVSQMLPSTKPAVKSGSAGAFNPSIFGDTVTRNTKLNQNAEPNDGDFVDRTTQELMIEQKLIPIDEATVLQEIIDDRHVEIEKIHKGLVEVNSMFTDLSRMVKEQESEIGQIYNNIDESHSKTKEAFAHIIEANRLHQNGQCSIS